MAIEPPEVSWTPHEVSMEAVRPLEPEGNKVDCFFNITTVQHIHIHSLSR